ncbi:sensor histidine kinase [Micromonospora sp. LZ34]
MYRHVPSWLARHRSLATGLWAERTYPFWVDPAVALLLSVVAVWLALGGAGAPEFADVARLGPEPNAPAPPVGPWREPEPDLLPLVAGTLLVTIPLAGRRRWPLPAFAVQFAAVLAVGDDNTWVTVLALLVGAYSLAACGRSPLMSIGALLAAASLVAVAFGPVELPVPDWATPFAILLPFGLFGVMVRALRARAAASAERAEALRAGQEAATRAAVADERARLARELHDVVSHHVSVMVIQAGAADKVIEARPDLARDAIHAVTNSGRQAMTELRHLLGVLAPDTGGDDLLRPQPGLDQLDALVDKVRAAGQPVTVAHTPVSLPRGVDLAAYRVVQEALTNALRYAPGAPTTVVVEPDGGALRVEVTDAGTANGVPTTVGAGSGLRGLSERLRLYGGTLQAGRRLTGGYRVSARFPLEAAATAAGRPE